MQITVSSSGAITGTVDSGALLETGPITGYVTTSGTSNATVVFQGNGTGTLHSTVTLAGGTLTGTGTESWKGNSYSLSYTLQAN